MSPAPAPVSRPPVGVVEVRPHENGAKLSVLRRLLLSAYLIGLLGTGAELALLGHFESPWQLVPLVLIGIALAVLGWHAAVRGPAPLKALRIAAIPFVLSGITGLVLHYRGNVEFELEMYPSLAGLGLFWKSIRGATPALAPGTMVALGLIGWAYARAQLDS